MGRMSPLTCPISGAFSVVDGEAVVFVEMWFQEGHRERTRECSQTLTKSRPLSTQYSVNNAHVISLELTHYNMADIYPGHISEGHHRTTDRVNTLLYLLKKGNGWLVNSVHMQCALYMIK